jgi:small-conductance mechanosensitive channel
MNYPSLIDTNVKNQLYNNLQNLHLQNISTTDAFINSMISITIIFIIISSLMIMYVNKKTKKNDNNSIGNEYKLDKVTLEENIILDKILLYKSKGKKP